MNNLTKFGIISSHQVETGGGGGSPAGGETIYMTSGSYSWTCPTGVTSVSVVAIGSGGASFKGDSDQYPYKSASGGGGGLGYKNNISVTPGNTYTVVIGSTGSTSNGGDSYFIDTSTVKGGGGTKASTAGSAGSGGNYTGDGGGNGGNGVAQQSYCPGGVSGGYLSTGGNDSPLGSTFTKTRLHGTSPGAGYDHYSKAYYEGFDGVVRIIWPGDTRSFPSTNVGTEYADPDGSWSVSSTNELIAWNWFDYSQSYDSIVMAIPGNSSDTVTAWWANDGVPTWKASAAPNYVAVTDGITIGGTTYDGYWTSYLSSPGTNWWSMVRDGTRFYYTTYTDMLSNEDFDGSKRELGT